MPTLCFVIYPTIVTPVLVDNHISTAIPQVMTIARLIARTMSLTIRLVVVLAVVGLSSAQASAAMHGKLCTSDVQVGLEQQVHSHSTESVNKLSTGHTHASPAINDGEIVDPGVPGHAGAGQSDAGGIDCCKSFCSSMAVLDGAPPKNQFDGTARQNAWVIQQLASAPEAAIYTPPNV